jgi:hypothetical protein
LVANINVDVMKVKHGLVSLCGGDCLDVDFETGVKTLFVKNGVIFMVECSVLLYANSVRGRRSAQSSCR